MKKTTICVASILIYTLAASINFAQAQESRGATINKRSQARTAQFQFTDLLARARPLRRAGFALMHAIDNAAASGPAFVITTMTSAPSQPVSGGGTGGRLTKWTGFTSNTSVIGDSNIYEDKFGKVGIGTTAPTSLLTVQGMIETFGGIKFADGTTQMTSAAGALFGVAHDGTLQGNGNLASPLGVAVPLNLTGTAGGFSGIVVGTNNGSGAGVSGAAPNGVGVIGVSETDNGVFGQSTSGFGVRGHSDSASGVRGESNTSDGVTGFSVSGDGVRGESNNIGVSGVSISGFGVRGIGGIGGAGIGAFGGDSSVGTGANGMLAVGGSGSGVGNFGGNGIVATSGPGILGATNGLAGRFNGNVQVTGTFSATGVKMFKIDHPLDPEYKYLNHAAIESSEVLNVYSGNATTDENGDAIVSLPDWFEALNKDFRYQLTVIGTFAHAIVAGKMRDNRFAIKTNAPNVEVSWQVTGVRSDAGMKKYPFQAEEAKAEGERGYYLTPEVFNQPEEKSIEWARNPEMMQRLKQQRLEAAEKIKKQQ